MERTIDFGRAVYDEKTGEGHIDPKLDPDNLECGFWMCFVPEVFKPIATEALAAASKEIMQYGAPKVTTHLKAVFITEMQRYFEQAREDRRMPA